MSRFGFQLTLGNVVCRPPRWEDAWLMGQFCVLGFTEKELSWLNRARIHQQALFVSDVMDDGGRGIDKKYLSHRPDSEQWSTLIFPVEQLCASDMRLWSKALWQL